MNLFSKAHRVVRSVETIEQYRVARRYVVLANKHLRWWQISSLQTVLAHKLHEVIN